jgi:hypothetical protein
MCWFSQSNYAEFVALLLKLGVTKNWRRRRDDAAAGDHKMAAPPC